MVNKQPGGHPEHDTLPIPTYDEAISRSSSSQSIANPQTVQDAEREGLLARRDGYTRYREPTVESARSSLDSHASSTESSTQDLRREIDQMEIIEPAGDIRFLTTGRLSKHINHWTHTLSTIHLPQLRRWLPSASYLREHAPTVKPNWILLGRVFALLLVLSLAYLVFLSNMFK